MGTPKYKSYRYDKVWSNLLKNPKALLKLSWLMAESFMNMNSFKILLRTTKVLCKLF